MNRIKFYTVLIAICCSSAKARPGYLNSGGDDSGHHEPLETIPSLESYGKISYPNFNLIELGSYQKGDIPPKVIHITKQITIKVPKPYPVKVPIRVPYPVHHKVPYPVVQTQIVKVPHPVPVEVTKHVHVPIEVPKPYPVPVEEFQPPHHTAQVSDYGQDLGHGGQIQDGGYGQEGHNFGQGGQDFGGQTYENTGHQEQVGGYGQQYQFYHAEALQSSQQENVDSHEASGGQVGEGERDHSGHEAQISATYGVPGQTPGEPIGDTENHDQQNQDGEQHASEHSIAFVALRQLPQHGWRPLIQDASH